MKIFTALLTVLLSLPALAHHSFAVYDFNTMIPYEGVVEELDFRNPHIAMKLRTTDENGNEIVINFIEGPPANMLARQGLKPDMVKVGTHITAVASPLHEDKTKFFLRIIRLENGDEYQ
jgi:ABC-type microcin C transport system permease subunit YejB